jgi:hypothetical protein
MNGLVSMSFWNRLGVKSPGAENYQLVLAEPFGAASRWFEEMCGRFITQTPSANVMSPEERWTAITQLYQSLV